MGRTTGWARGTKIRLAMWATAPRARMAAIRGITSFGMCEVFPRIIRV